MEAVILDLLLQPPGQLTVFRGLAVQTANQGKLPGGRGGGLACVQVLHVLPKQLLQGGFRLLLQPPLVILLVFQEGLPGVQGQQFQGGHPLEEPGQGPYPAPDALRGEDGQVVRPEQVEEQLVPAAHRAVLRQAGDAHELPGGLALAEEQRFFPRHSSCPHS